MRAFNILQFNLVEGLSASEIKFKCELLISNRRKGNSEVGVYRTFNKGRRVLRSVIGFLM